MRISLSTIKAEVQALFNQYYQNAANSEGQYIMHLGVLDPDKFAKIVTLKTGHKMTTIDRYRREFEARRKRG